MEIKKMHTVSISEKEFLEEKLKIIDALKTANLHPSDKATFALIAIAYIEARTGYHGFVKGDFLSICEQVANFTENMVKAAEKETMQ